MSSDIPFSRQEELDALVGALGLPNAYNGFGEEHMDTPYKSNEAEQKEENNSHENVFHEYLLCSQKPEGPLLPWRKRDPYVDNTPNENAIRADTDSLPICSTKVGTENVYTNERGQKEFNSHDEDSDFTDLDLNNVDWMDFIVQSDSSDDDSSEEKQKQSPDHKQCSTGGVLDLKWTESDEEKINVFSDNDTSSTKSLSSSNLKAKSRQMMPYKLSMKKILFCCWIPVMILLSIFAYIFLSSSRNRPDDNSDLLTSLPTFPPTSFSEQLFIDDRAQRIVSALSAAHKSMNGSDAEFSSLIADNATAQYFAARWIIHDDQRELMADDPSLIQRYVLAIFYHASNRVKAAAGQEKVTSFVGHHHNWKTCGAKSAYISEKEVYYVHCGSSTSTSPHDNDITYMRFLSSVNECNWFGVKCSVEGLVVELNINDNGLHGTIPNEFSLLPELTQVSLKKNSLYGKIPSRLGQLSKLVSLNLSNNRLEGNIPLELGQIAHLQNLDLGHNLLSGHVSDSLFMHWSSLRILKLGSNNLHGSIPDSVYRVPTSLDTLELFSNKFTGTISSMVGTRFSHIKTLRFDDNGLTGTIPDFWTRLDELQELNVAMNQLTGTLPTSIFRATNLRLFHVGANLLSGSIPVDFNQLTKIRQIILWSNKFTGTISSEIGSLKNLELLHLSLNLLSGTVPAEICLLRLVKLTTLSSDCDGNKPIACYCCTYCSNGYEQGI